jgi:hypothetical protein
MRTVGLVTVVISIAKVSVPNYAAITTFWNLALAFGMVVLICRDLQLYRRAEGPEDRAVRYLQGIGLPITGDCKSPTSTSLG